MADNLDTLKALVNSSIDPGALPGGILAVNHNGLLMAILDQVGRFTGFPFVAKRDGAVVAGSLLWNANAMDNVGTFNITMAELNSDGNKMSDILDLAAPGDIIHIKDFIGNSAFLDFHQYTVGVDGFTNPVYTIEVNGFAQNPAITYGVAEEHKAIVEIIKRSSASNIFTEARPIIMKDPANGNPAILEAGDYVKIFITNRILEGIWNAGSADLTDPANYNLLNEYDLTP